MKATEFSMEHIKQEYPSYGTGDKWHPDMEFCRKRSYDSEEFVYKEHHRFLQGNQSFLGLPGYLLREKETEATTLEIYLQRSDYPDRTVLTIYYFWKTFSAIEERNGRDFATNGRMRAMLDRAMSKCGFA
ncbi:MAG: glycoside hydrolase family 36 N-terminal domain-containing protein [Coprococcus sp.]